MKSTLLLLALFACLAALMCRTPVKASDSNSSEPGERNFIVKGVVLELNPDNLTVVIRHEQVADYMPAMTMPFHVKAANELSGLQIGDEIQLRLVVTSDKSWIDQIKKLGHRTVQVLTAADQPPPPAMPVTKTRHPLLDYKFTNELGAPVSFNDYRGQAIAYTFFFTRCPVPDFCPRLSRNFEEASRKLAALPNIPTNWHLISVTFDSDFDSPAVLKAYAQRYQYDSNHWTFLTGPKEKIGELARLSGVNYQPEEGLFNHNFRTLIIDSEGKLQMSYPIGGDLSDAIAADLLKAAGATNMALPK